MPKLTASSALSFTALCFLVISGCDMNRPPIQAPDAAWNTYQGRLAEQCSDKHLANLPAERLNEIAKDYYIDADTQIQQLIDRRRRQELRQERRQCRMLQHRLYSGERASWQRRRFREASVQ